MYSVGKIRSTTLNLRDDAGALGLEAGATVEAFTRLFKEGVLYHSTANSVSDGKRDNTMCAYHDRGRICYGQIVIFITHPEQCVVVRQCKVSSQTLMDKAGPPCREVLAVHKEVDLLHHHIKPIVGYEKPQAVQFHKLCGKAVILHGASCDYMASQPNNFEKH